MQIFQRFRFDIGHPVERLRALVSGNPRRGEASGLPRDQARERFALRGDIVRRHHGNVARTVDGGIHAALAGPGNALRAALETRRVMPECHRSLDYHDEAVNLAARLEGYGRPGDISTPEAFARDPAVAEPLRDYPLAEGLAGIAGYPEPKPVERLAPAPLAAASHVG